MERQQEGAGDQRNQYFLGNMQGIIYQESPMIVYRSDNQNPTYNIFTSSQHYSQPHNTFSPLEYTQLTYNPPNSVFLSYQTQNPLILRQAPREQMGTNGGSTSSHASSEPNVKQEVRDERIESGSDGSGELSSQSESIHKKNPNYYWSVEENKRYYQFVRDNVQWFKLRYHKRKNLKINVLMSNKVGTRTAVQCHSHHQKMMQKYKTVGNLLRKMKSLEEDVRDEEDGSVKMEERNQEKKEKVPLKRTNQ